MNDPMRILKADHRDVEQLLKQLAKSEAGRERNELAHEVATKLTAHMEIEESIVYPPVSLEVGTSDAHEAETEHQLARQGLETMLSMLAKPGFGAAVQMLLGGIRHHVHEEETELLPALKTALGRDDWSALGDAIAHAKQQDASSTSKRSASRSGSPSTRAGGSARTTTAKAPVRSAAATSARTSRASASSSRARSSRSRPATKRSSKSA